MRQITFEVPEELAERFDIEVPASEQSRIIAEILQRASRPQLTDEQWGAICDAANNDPETQEIEREMAALPDTMTEEWHDSVEHSTPQ